MPFTVSQFVEFLNAALASAVFPSGAEVEGEVAEYRVSQDKWIWFLLKDGTAVVPCFATVWQLRQPLEDGMLVRVHGTPKVHPKSGKFSLTVDRAEPIGAGALRRAYELLKKKLADEGLFAPARKRPLPRFPRRLGLITSREAAAYTDFLRILGDRWGGLEITFYPVAVQGREAAGDIVNAFRWFNEHPDAAEVLVLTRGGGAFEDLHAFNDEATVRAVFTSRIPVVVGVGHERDETLCDLAADLRAATPTNAAELVVPDRREIASFLEGGVSRMALGLRGEVGGRQARLAGDVGRLEALLTKSLTARRHVIDDFEKRTAGFLERLVSYHRWADGLADRLFTAARQHAGRFTAALTSHERLLRGFDPRRVLSRGYAIVRHQGRTVTAAATVPLGQEINIQLALGQLGATVTENK